MAREAIIGRVSVKVTAEVEPGVRKKLQKDLEKATQGLEGEIDVRLEGKNLKQDAKRMQQEVERELDDVDIKADLDTSKAEASGKKLKKDLERELDDVEIDVDVDGSQARRSMSKTIKDLKTQAAKSITVDIDAHAKRSSMAKAQQEIERMISKVKAEIPVGLKSADLTKVNRQVEDMRQQIGENKFRFQAELDPFTKAKTLRQMKRLSKDVRKVIEDVKIKVDVDARIDDALSKVNELTNDKVMEFKAKLSDEDFGKIWSQAESLIRQIEMNKIDLEMDLDSKSMASAMADARNLRGRLESLIGDIKAKVELDTKVANTDRAVREALRRAQKLTAKEYLTVGMDVDPEAADRVHSKIENLVRQIELLKVELGTDLDPKSAAATMAKVKALQHQLQDTMGKIRAEIQASLNTKKLEAQTARARKLVESKMKDIFANVSPKVDEKKLIETQLKIRAALEEIEDLKVKLSITEDPGEIAKIRGRMKLLEKQLAMDVEKDVHVELDKSSWSKVWLQIKMLTRPETKTINVKANDMTGNVWKTLKKNVADITGAWTGSRFLWDLHKKKFEAFKNFDQVALQAGKIATTLAVAGSYTAAIGGDILSILDGIAKIAGIAPVLVAGFAQMAAQAWILNSAFSKFGEKFPEIADGFKSLHSSIDTNFWKRASEPMQEMYQKIFPEFTDGMNKLAYATGGAFGQLADGIANNFAGKLGPIFTNMSAATEILGDGMDGLTGSLATLMSVGSKYLPQVAQGFTDLMISMDNWLASSAASGAMDRWIQTAMENLKFLGSGLWDMISTLGILGEYAGEVGAATLESFANSMAGMRAVVESADFETGFKNVMASVYTFVHQLSDALLNGFKNIAIALSDVIPTILGDLGPSLQAAIASLMAGFASEEFTGGLVKMFSYISQGIMSLVPVLDLIGPKIGIVMSLVGAMFAALMPILASFIGEMATLLSQIGPPLEGFINQMGTTMTALVGTLGPLFEGIGAGLVPVINGLTQAMAVFEGLAPVIAPVVASLGQFAQTLGETLGPIIPKIAEGIAAMLAVVAPALDQLVQAASGLLEALQPVLSFISSMFPLIGTIIGVVLGVVISTITGIINGITNVINGVKAVFDGIITWVSGFVQVITSLFQGDLNGVIEGFKTMFSGLVTFLGGIFQTIIGVVQVWLNVGLLGPITKGIGIIKGVFSGGFNGLKTIVTNVVNAIKTNFSNFMTGLTNGAKGGIEAVKNFFTNGFNAIKNGVSSFASTVSNKFSSMMSSVGNFVSNGINAAKNFFSQGMTNIVNSVRTGVDNVLNFFRNLPSQIRATLSGLGTLLLDAGKQIVQGLIDGINSMISGVQSALGNLTNMIPDWKGPPKRDKILLKPAGEMIIEGLIKGIRDTVPELKSELQAITELFRDTDFKLGSVDASSLSEAERTLKAAGRQVAAVEVDGKSTATAGMVNNFEMHMGNQYTPDMISGEIIYGLRREQRRGVYAKEA